MQKSGSDIKIILSGKWEGISQCEFILIHVVKETCGASIYGKVFGFSVYGSTGDWNKGIKTGTYLVVFRHLSTDIEKESKAR